MRQIGTLAAQIQNAGKQHLYPIGALMSQSVTRWMASDTIDDGRTEYGPFASSLEAEIVARRAGFPFLLKYDVQLGEQDEVQDARLVIIELPGVARRNDMLYTRCATCGESGSHSKIRQAELWSDIHEFEHLRHRVRFFVRTEREGLVEIATWRSALPSPAAE